MSLELAWSDGLSIKTNPTWVIGKDHFMALNRPGLETIFISPDLTIAEIEYTINELETFRPEAAVAIKGFKAYLASMEGQTIDLPPPFTPSVHLVGSEIFRDYTIPELPTSTRIDWCGVLIDPTDFLYATQYVMRNTPVEPNDPRLLLIQSMRTQLTPN